MADYIFESDRLLEEDDNKAVGTDSTPTVTPQNMPIPQTAANLINESKPETVVARTVPTPETTNVQKPGYTEHSTIKPEAVDTVAAQDKLAPDLVSMTGQGYDEFKGQLDTKKQEQVEASTKQTNEAVKTFGKELAPQVASGIGDMVNQYAEFGIDIADLGGLHLQLTDKDGNYDLQTLTKEQAIAQRGTRGKIIPVAAPANTQAGRVIRTLTGFVAAYAVPSMAIGKLGVAASKALPAVAQAKLGGTVGQIATSVAKGTAAGAIGDMVMYDKDQVRLSTLGNQLPFWGELIPDYLADTNDGNESLWEGRFKAAAEGALLGGPIELATSAFGIIRKSKMAHRARQTEKATTVLSPEAAMEQVARNEEIKAQAIKDMVQPVEEMVKSPRLAADALDGVEVLDTVLDDVIADPRAHWAPSAQRPTDRPVDYVAGAISSKDENLILTNARQRAEEGGFDDLVLKIDELQARKASDLEVANYTPKGGEGAVQQASEVTRARDIAYNDAYQSLDAEIRKVEEGLIASGDLTKQAALKDIHTSLRKVSPERLTADRVTTKALKDISYSELGLGKTGDGPTTGLIKDIDIINLRKERDALRAERNLPRGERTRSKSDITDEINNIKSDIDELEIKAKEQKAAYLAETEGTAVDVPMAAGYFKDSIPQATIDGLTPEAREEAVEKLVAIGMENHTVKAALGGEITPEVMEESLRTQAKNALRVGGDPALRPDFVVDTEFAEGLASRIEQRIVQQPSMAGFFAPIQNAIDGVRGAKGTAAQKAALKKLDDTIQATRDEIFVGKERFRGAQLRRQDDKAWSTPKWGQTATSTATETPERAIWKSEIEKAEFLKSINEPDMMTAYENIANMKKVVNDKRATLRKAKAEGVTGKALERLERDAASSAESWAVRKEEIRQAIVNQNAPVRIHAANLNSERAAKGWTKVPFESQADSYLRRERMGNVPEFDYAKGKGVLTKEQMEVKASQNRFDDAAGKVWNEIESDINNTYNSTRIMKEFKSKIDDMGQISDEAWSELSGPLGLNSKDNAALKRHLQFAVDSINPTKKEIEAAAKVGKILKTYEGGSFKLKNPDVEAYNPTRITEEFKSKLNMDTNDRMLISDADWDSIVKPLGMSVEDEKALRANLEYIVNNEATSTYGVNQVANDKRIARIAMENYADAIEDADNILSFYAKQKLTPKPRMAFYEFDSAGKPVNIAQLDESDAVYVNLETDLDGNVLKPKVTPGIRQADGKPIEFEADLDNVTITPDELLTRNPDKSVYLNTDRIEGIEDIERALRNSLEANKAAMAGTSKTFEGMKEGAAELKDSLNSLLTREINRPFSAEESIAAREVLNASSNNLIKLAKLATAPNADNVAMYNFNRALAIHNDISERVLQGRKSTAQSLASWRITVGSGDMEKAAQISRLMEGKSATTKRTAEMILDIADKNFEGVSKAAGRAMHKRFEDSFYQVWILGLVSGLKTHAVNMASNLGMTLTGSAEAYVSGAIQALQTRSAAPIRAANAQWTALWQTCKESFDLARHKTRNEVLESTNKMEYRRVDGLSPENWNVDPDSMGGKAMGYVNDFINIPGKMLEAGDMFFKGINQRMMLRRLAAEDAIASGKAGKEYAKHFDDVLANPTDEMLKVSNDYAAMQTFTNDLGNFGQKFQGAVNAFSLPDDVLGGANIGRFFAPFIRTPLNIFKAGFKRTPLIGMIVDGERAAWKRGGAERADVYARQLMGSSALLGGYLLTKQGIITGGGPANYEALNALKRTGWQPYSVKVGDKYYSYGRLEGLGTVLGLGADLANTIGEADGDEEASNEVVSTCIASFGKQTINKTFVKGIVDVVSIFGSGNPDTISDYMRRTVGTMVPYSSLVHSLNRYTDSTMYDFDPEDGEGVIGEVKALMKQSIAGLPYVGTDAPKVRDVWGEVRHFNDGQTRVNAFISPISVTEAKHDPVNDLVAKAGIALSMPAKTVMGVQLTPSEYEVYCEKAGKMAKKILDDMEQSGSFKDITIKGKDSEFSNIVSLVMNGSRKQALGEMLGDPKFRKLVERVEANKERRVSERTGVPVPPKAAQPANKTEGWGKSPYDRKK